MGAACEDPEPQDRYHGIYFAMLLAGVGFLLPYNSFITDVDFLHHKYPGIMNELLRVFKNRSGLVVATLPDSAIRAPVTFFYLLKAADIEVIKMAGGGGAVCLLPRGLPAGMEGRRWPSKEGERG